jgi:copper(I)-binding protein
MDAGPYRVGIHGPAMAAIVGAGPDIAVETPLGSSLTDGTSTFLLGTVQVGASVVKTMTIRNTGTTTLSGLSVSKDGAAQAEYVVGALGATSVAAGASTTFTVTFTPTVAGTRVAALHIASNDPDENPFDFELNGEGQPPGPEIVVEEPAGTGLVDGTSTVSFGTVLVNANTVKTFTIKNIGTMEMNGLTVTKDGAQAGEYLVTGTGAATLAPGASTTFTVTFTAAGPGVRSAALHITSNDPDENPFDIALTGTGMATTIGPNAFGYTATSEFPYSFTDISTTGTVVLDNHG